MLTTHIVWSLNSPLLIVYIQISQENNKTIKIQMKQKFGNVAVASQNLE